MATKMIRRGAVLLAVPALMALSGGTAAADPEVQGNATPANPADFSDCPEKSVCYYTGLNGTGLRCHWDVAIKVHQDTCVVAGQNVRSVYNHGTDPSFLGVCSYRWNDFNDTPPVLWLRQGTAVNLGGEGWKVLSHRWVPGTAC